MEDYEKYVTDKKYKKYWTRLWTNTNMSSKHGAAGPRIENNPKLSGRLRKGNQSTRRHEITIEKDDLKKLWLKQEGKCHWLGVDMLVEDLFVAHSPFAPSVDRLDSSKGYHIDNIALTTRLVNKGRGAYDNSDFETKLTSLLEDRFKSEYK